MCLRECDRPFIMMFSSENSMMSIKILIVVMSLYKKAAMWFVNFLKRIIIEWLILWTDIYDFKSDTTSFLVMLSRLCVETEFEYSCGQSWFQTVEIKVCVFVPSFFVVSCHDYNISLCFTHSEYFSFSQHLLNMHRQQPQNYLSCGRGS